MGTYYLHRVGSQEMGSIGDNKKPQRGRYFLVSKIAVDFFPHLSSVVMNDKSFITIIPLRQDEKLTKIVSTIDYHNSKYADIECTANHKRNETRLYLNKQLDPDLYFETNDVIVFQRLIDSSDNDDVVYTLSRFREGDSHYNEISKLLENNRARKQGFHALYNGSIDFISVPDIANIDVEVSDKAIQLGENETTDLLEADDESTMGAGIFNSVLFRNFVMNAYEYKCAITKKVIRFGNLVNLEAAHIKPQAHSGTFLPCNGIAMSRDMHFAFDKGFFTIDKNMEVVVHDNLKGTEFYEEYNGTKIFLPKVQYFRPNENYLQYHHDVIFGSFKQIRQL